MGGEWKIYVAPGEVTSLKHEVGNHTVEFGTGVAKAFLPGAEGTEVLDGFGGDVIVEVEIDTTGLH